MKATTARIKKTEFENLMATSVSVPVIRKSKQVWKQRLNG